MKKLCIVTKEETALSRLLEKHFDATRVAPSDLSACDLSVFDGFAVLLGTGREDNILLGAAREMLDAEIKKGKRVFAEYCRAIGPLRSYDTLNTRYERPVTVGEVLSPCPAVRTLLDEQSNDRVVYLSVPEAAVPIAVYMKNPKGFYRLPDTEPLPSDPKNYALFTVGENLLVCSFRLCRFDLAKFSPRSEWAKVIAGIVDFLGGKCDPSEIEDAFRSVIRLGTPEGVAPGEVAARALAWFPRNGMLIHSVGAPYAVREGLDTHVYADGTHKRRDEPRPDCTGEVSFAYFMKWLSDGDEAALATSNALMRYVIDSKVKDGPHRGMMRWTSTSFFACYGDDAARALILPGLLRAFLGDETYLADALEGLDYLVSTTGSDGLRFCRNDFFTEDDPHYNLMSVVRDKTSGKWRHADGPAPNRYTAEELRAMPADCPSAHYNGTFISSLLLAYLVTGKDDYYERGVKAARTLMAHYPETAREHSETEEECRLILPLALLFATAKEKDADTKAWLYRVAKDLNSHRRDGGFAEWDTGYIACCAGTSDEECSVLSANGDPVTDLLYSVNWLPLGVSVAAFVTRDPYFEEMKRYVTDFFASAQIVSPDGVVDGIWPRSIDLARREVFGVTNDVGWAPWSVETGWTVGEIVAGLYLSDEKFRPCFERKFPLSR